MTIPALYWFRRRQFRRLQDALSRGGFTIRINPAFKQWTYVVNEFKSAVAEHENSMSGSPVDWTAYQEGVLHGFTTGLALAHERRKALRFSFFKSPARNERRLLMNFVSEIKDSAYGLQGKDTAFTAGMIDSLESWIETLREEIRAGAGTKYDPAKRK